jgi:predicted porin
MKKIFAILALALTSVAFAQSNVSITGNIDTGFASTQAQDNTADKKEIMINGSSTSAIKFAITEDLGNGVNVGFLGAHNLNQVSGQTGNAAVAYSQNNFFNDEVWVNLASKTFGGIKLGAPNAGMLETNAQAQPFGTAFGGGYNSAGINRLLGQTTTLGVNQYLGGASANGRVVRSERSARYDTPAFYGFSANLTKAAMNDSSSTATSNSNGFTDATVNYSNGPLNVAYSNTRVEAGANVAQGNAASGALTAGANVKYQFLAANYTVGPATVYYGQTTGKTEGLTSNKDVESRNVALKYALNSSVDLLGNLVKVTDNAATSAKNQDLQAISAIYKFSKRTNTYATYQIYDTDKSSGSTGKVTQYIVGLRHQF